MNGTIMLGQPGYGEYCILHGVKIKLLVYARTILREKHYN
jgi:hypothetical protein